ncbi:Fic family protein [Olivibacter domesticus]|uniref:Fic/DOC family protein n=1 Tax=Olivibacter domesticus TaxID=407022 RepID=A0A1H7GUZ6_OLID1|nr:Fic family protein [Olivibacter domesticus]SEK41911.1 Fic/DOC family protein [Olivibacter domesticus]
MYIYQFHAWPNFIWDTDELSAIAHLWFVTLHPFEDGNGRISRAIADMQLARADGVPERFYSMSAQIRKERNKYYTILERTQSGDLDITEWLKWFIECLGRAIDASDIVLNSVKRKAKLWMLPVSQTFNDRQRMMLNKLLEGFEGKLTSSKWAKIAKCSQDTATRDIQDLIAKGILVKDEAGGRSTNKLPFSILIIRLLTLESFSLEQPNISCIDLLHFQRSRSHSICLSAIRRQCCKDRRYIMVHLCEYKNELPRTL